VRRKDDLRPLSSSDSSRHRFLATAVSRILVLGPAHHTSITLTIIGRVTGYAPSWGLHELLSSNDRMFNFFPLASDKRMNGKSSRSRSAICR
jgi:hypothetical protein